MAPHLFSPGTPEYERATSPANRLAPQRPSAVAAPASEEQLAEVVLEARNSGRRLVPQATGHGAGVEIGADTILVDTSRLASVSIDPDARTATTGSGVQWSIVDPAAEKHGMLALAGSSRTVGVSGYTFDGGIGWLVRRYGLASGSLRSVRFVDGAGRIRIASDDAGDPVDRDAIWSFRGAGGVGIATSLEFSLVPVPDLHAGYLLWPIDALGDVVEAWADATRRVGPGVASNVAVIHMPPMPPVPEELRGKTVVHIGIADPDGADGAQPLLDAVRAAAEPMTDTWGPSDAARLAGIHLDPEGPGSSIGEGRWLGDAARDVALDLLKAAAPEDSALAIMEVRHVQSDAPVLDGALTSPAGPFLWHTVAPLMAPDARPRAEDQLTAVRERLGSADVGTVPASWVEGTVSVPDALRPETRDRARRIADEIDPDHVILRARALGF